MAATGFTPISLYYSTTSSAVPTAGNLTNGELAINITDKKLYAKDNAGNVFLLADASSGSTTATNLAGGAAGSLPYQSAANTTTFLAIGAANRVLTSSGTAPQWVTSLTSLTGVSSSSITNTSLTSGRVVYSTTAGLETDSANLTFDGTTLTAAGLATGGSVTLSGGTANGVLYLNGSKVVSSGSAVSYDGTTFTTTGAANFATSTGNVGIGTASPSYKVDVSGTLGVSSDISIGTASDVDRVIGRVGTYSIGVRSLTLRAGSTSDNTSGTGGAYITLKNALNAGGTYGTIDYSANDGGAGTAAHIWGVNGTERMRINASGNVGIGTASPGAKLDVVSEIRVTSGSNIGRLLVDGSDFYVGSRANIPMRFETNSVTRMTIDASGNLTCAGVYSATVGATNRDVYVDNTGLIGYVSSIRASKTNIAPLDNPSWLLQLQPVTFNYRAKDEDGKYTDTPDGPQQYGLIAEDVEAVAPDLCYYDEVEGQQELRGINYSRLITPLLKLVQDQQSLINDLTARVRALEAKG